MCCFDVLSDEELAIIDENMVKLSLKKARLSVIKEHLHLISLFMMKDWQKFIKKEVMILSFLRFCLR